MAGEAPSCFVLRRASRQGGMSARIIQVSDQERPPNARVQGMRGRPNFEDVVANLNGAPLMSLGKKSPCLLECRFTELLSEAKVRVVVQNM